MSAINWDKIAKDLQNSDSENTEEESPRILIKQTRGIVKNIQKTLKEQQQQKEERQKQKQEKKAQKQELKQQKGRGIDDIRGAIERIPQQINKDLIKKAEEIQQKQTSFRAHIFDHFKI